MNTPVSILPDQTRPLTLGELLDRAVTLFVRNAWIFLALAAIVYVPVGIAQLSMSGFWQLYLDAIAKSASNPRAGAMDLQALSRFGVPYALQMIFWIVGAPLATAAMVHVTTNLLSGVPVTLREAVRFGMARWGHVLLYVVLWLVAFIAFGFSVGMIVGVSASILAIVLHSAAIVLALTLICLLASLILGLVGFVSANVGLITVIAEAASPFTAFGAGFARAMNRTYFWRSVLMGLIAFVIAMGFSVVAGVAGFALLGLLHTGIPLVIFSAVASVLQFGFGTVFMVLYYNDLRVRREGVDLTSLAAHIAHPA